MSIIVFIVVAIVIRILYTVGFRVYRFHLFYRRVNTIPGPNYAIPFLGMMLKLVMMPKKDHLEWFEKLGDQQKDGIVRTWHGFRAFIYIRKAEHVEVILRSNKEIRKDGIYSFLVPWLGEGLVTSTGTQWFHHRRLITPAFHFNILQDFAEVMIDKAAIMNNCIEREIKIHGDKPFDVFNLGVRCALDIICETALGTNIHAQEAIPSEYISAVQAITDGVIMRSMRPWLFADWIYYKTALGKSFKKAVDTAQNFSTQVIQRKLKEGKSGDRSNETIGKGKKKVFVDLLLEANEKEDNPLTIEEIRDEINTFMFAGHDTTGGLIGWTLFRLGDELDVQRKVHEELDEILGNSDDHATLKKLPNLNYLDKVIKEVLRLHPSVTCVSRSLLDDLKIGDHTIPAGANLVVQIHHLHRDPSVWPDPLRFDPDRFLPENTKGRNPYAYVPFSAGPRNCIGQKFAMLEAKLILTQILRKFTIKSVKNHSTIEMHSDLILRPINGVFVNMSKRSTDLLLEKNADNSSEKL